MNDKKLINCNEVEDEHDVCTIKFFTVYYKTNLL